jgi:spore maturation protein CgeB
VEKKSIAARNLQPALAMKLVVFGLSISSSWGNGHATLWRGLIEALAARGHRIVFFERDVPYYAAHRDRTDFPATELILYRELDRIDATRHFDEADAAIVTSYCPDAVSAAVLAFDSRARLKVFYDLDTPITLDHLAAGLRVPYLPEGDLSGFDLVLSYAGGGALEELARRLGARQVAPLYGSVDPRVHRPAGGSDDYRADLSYLGTYAEDRQEGLAQLLIEPARAKQERSFVVGGAQYPNDVRWPDNVRRYEHVPPHLHSTFYCSSPVTLSITRAPMLRMGWCPSGRLFEAAACGVPVISDDWEGLETFFTPGSEILVAHQRDDVLDALDLAGDRLAQIGKRAQERALDEHTAAHRAETLISLLTNLEA